jgi:hypothetical protein
MENWSEKYLFGWVIKSLLFQKMTGHCTQTEERMTGHCNATDQCSTSSSVFLFFVQNFVNKKIMSAAHSKGLGFCMHALERERERERERWEESL